MPFRYLAFFILVCVASPARAQWFIPGDPEDWNAQIGLGAAVRPDFPGAASLVASPVPYFDITYKKQFFLNTGRGLGTFLYGDKNGRLKYMLGASIGPSFDTRGSKDVPGLPKVGVTASGQAFGEIFFDRWSVELTVHKDMIGKGHEGLRADLGLNYTQRIDGKRGLLRVGPQVQFGSGDFMDSFFSVTSEQSPAANLPTFNAKAGAARLGGQAFLSYPIAEHWNVVSAATYYRLVNDAADSPVTRDKNQLSLFLALAYRF
ncbi:MltA-interacting MipA family protein [Iodidimonas gelatinilytica]|uniref:MltA-interacting MipA family protein n=1 Tax=Iodidimonas gelatinilytica TaxID=1236966 RepID=A0A5A7MMN3_9PROT|nr:MipA/OmpV family protein [Iodidimonas gelatinilytica]GEQ97241.1 MltA-interacting MipA family protein [Iodidimonas gelatinilytica]GEQ99570.1 MltA-interacting MipA family protein [Iodidimonas gelatinilytica]